MILPEMREKILNNNREKFTVPELSEEEINRIEERIKFAQHFQKPLLITYFKDRHCEELITFAFRLLPDALECILAENKKRRISFKQIINVELL